MKPRKVSEFSNILLRVGEGTEPEDDNQMIHIDTRYIIPGNSIADLVTSLYGNIFKHFAHHQYFILCPKNETADLINNYSMSLLPGEGTTLLSADSVEGIAASIFPLSF